jgi:hypothetical protein
LVEIDSKVAMVNAAGEAALHAITVECDTGGKCILSISVDRAMNPRGAKLVLDDGTVKISLEEAVFLLNSEWGAALYNPELAKVNWETVKGYDRDSGDSEGEEASAHAAEVPAVEPPSRGRGRWPVTPRGGSATKSLREVLDASRNDVDGKKSANAAFKKAEEISAELRERMNSCGLEGFVHAFGKARIHSSVLLSAYRVSEVEASLQRPMVLGAKFKFDRVQKRLMQALGAMADEAAPAAAIETAGEFGDEEGEVVMAFDFDEVMRTERLPAHTGEVRRPRGTTATPPPIGLALEGCALSSLLLGQALLSAEDTVGSATEVRFVTNILDDFALASGSAVASKGSAHDSLGDVIDSLEVLLGQLVRKSFIERSALKPPAPGSRAAARHAKSLALAVEDARSRPPSPPEMVGPSTDGLSNLAKVIAASNCKPLSEKDEKVSEELAASRTRLQRVCDNPTSMEALAALAELTESKETPVNQLKHYKQVCMAHPAVSDLIASSHVRMPTGAGEFSALHPGAELIVKHTRIVRTGLKAALTAVTRKMVPAGANMAGAIDAALAGALHSAADGSVAHLASSKDAKHYLGMAAKPLSDKTANSRAELQVLGIKALPLLARMLEELHPADTTIGLTMTDVLALYGRGIAVRTVPETVDGVLVPLFRAYEEAFGRFQKSATQSAPVLAEVWELEQAAPTVMAFVSLLGTAEASRGSIGGDGGEAASALEKRLAELEKKVKQRAPNTTPVAQTAAQKAAAQAGATPPDPNSNNSKKKAARMLREAADGAAGGVPAAAPAAP